MNMLPYAQLLAERLGRSTRLEVIGHGGELEQIMVEVQAGHPDLVLLEVKRKDGMGLELLRQLSELPVLRGWLCSPVTRPGGKKMLPSVRAQRATLLRTSISEELIARIEDIIEA